MKSLNTFKSYLLLVAVLAGCQKNSVARYQNEQAKDVQVAHDLVAVQAIEKSLSDIDLSQTEDQSIHEKDPKRLLELIKKLSGFVLNPDYVENPKFRNLEPMRALLSDFNQAFLRFYDMDKGSIESLKILDSYLATAESGCDLDVKKNCKNISFFALDFRSIDVLALRLRKLDKEIDANLLNGQTCTDECVKKVVDYYRILKLVSDEKNQEKRTEVEFLYLKHARDYANYLNSLKNDGAIPLSVREQLSTHASYFESLISKYSGDPTGPDFKEFILNFKPWSYSRLEPDLFPYGTEKMFAYAAQSYLYIQDKQGNRNLNPDLAQAISASQANGVEDKIGINFSDKVRDLKLKNSKLLSAVSIDPDLIDSDRFKNEYFFIVDRLYRGHINSVEAQELWQGSKQEKTKLLGILEYYIKIEALGLLEDTNKKLLEIYQEKVEQKNIMIKVLNDSSQMTFKWNRLMSQVDIMNVFISTLFEKADRDQEYLRTNALLKSMKTNVKYLSVYPNMMVLTYFISSLNDDVLNPVGSDNNDRLLRPDQIILDFFDARYRPWFLFGNEDSFGISKVGVIYSYHFAIITGTFEAYNNKNVSDPTEVVDQSKLFEKVTAKYLVNEKMDIEKRLKGLQDNFAANPTFLEALGICKRLNAIAATGKPDPDLVISQNFTDLDKYASVGNYGSGFMSSFREFYLSNAGSPADLNPTPGTPDIIRTSFDRKLIRIQAMVKILESDQKYIKASDSEKTEMLGSINNQVTALKNLETRYYQVAMDLYRKISQCDNLMGRVERLSEYGLIRSEAEYLGRVYDVYASIDANPQAAEQILKKANEEFHLENTDLDSFQSQGYRYTKFGLFLRLAKQLSLMSPKVVVASVADLTVLQHYGEGISLPVHGADLKLVSKEDFVMSGVKRMNGIGNTSYVNWSETFSMQFKKKKIIAMTALYKLGYYLGKADRITPDEIISEVFDMIDLINITPEDTSILKLLGLTNKLGTTDANMALDELNKVTKSNDLKIALLDTTFMDVSTDPRMHDPRDDHSPGKLEVPAALLNAEVFNNILDDAVNLYGTVNSFEEFLLPPDSNINVKLRELYQPAVEKTRGMVAEFEKAVTAREKAETAKELKFNFDLNDRGIYSVDFSSTGPIFLSRNRRKAYDDSVYDFSGPKTHHCFDSLELPALCNVTGFKVNSGPVK